MTRERADRGEEDRRHVIMSGARRLDPAYPIPIDSLSPADLRRTAISYLAKMDLDEVLLKGTGVATLSDAKNRMQYGFTDPKRPDWIVRVVLGRNATARITPTVNLQYGGGLLTFVSLDADSGNWDEIIMADEKRNMEATLQLHEGQRIVGARLVDAVGSRAAGFISEDIDDIGHIDGDLPALLRTIEENFILSPGTLDNISPKRLARRCLHPRMTGVRKAAGLFYSPDSYTGTSGLVYKAGLGVNIA